MQNYDYLPDDSDALKSEIARLDSRISELESQETPTINWRRGGAQSDPELPTLPAEIASASIGVSGVLFQWRYLGGEWKPGGKWWRECKWWCYRSEIEATIPTEKLT